MKCFPLLLAALVGLSAAQDTVMMIVGGRYRPNDNPTVTNYLNSVEIFGCPGSEDASKPLKADFPYESYLVGLVYVPDDDMVLACGGYAEVGGTHDECFTIKPTDNDWQDGPPMNFARFNFNMVIAEQPGSTGGEKFPMTIGSTRESEVLLKNGANSYEWQVLRDLPNNAWFQSVCVAQDDNDIYVIRDSILRFNTVTWNFDTIHTSDELPLRLRLPEMCTIATVDGKKGIFTKYGYFYDINGDEWIKKEFPFFDVAPSEDNLPNVLYSYRGKPTMFGNIVCANDGTCTHRQVYQYDADSDSWKDIGTMNESRDVHSAVEVPSSFCSLTA